MVTEKQIEKFKKAIEEHKKCSMKTPKGVIFTAGGILSKIEDNIQYIYHGGKWIKGEEAFIKKGDLSNLNKLKENNDTFRRQKNGNTRNS